MRDIFLSALRAEEFGFWQEPSLIRMVPVLMVSDIRVSSASTVVHVLQQLALAVGRPLKSYGCGQRRFFRTATLHSVQLPVCCFEEGFNRFAVLRKGSHSNACGKCRLLTIPCKPIANARRDKPCGRGGRLRQHHSKLVAPVSRGCVDSPTKQTEHLADAA